MVYHCITPAGEATDLCNLRRPGRRFFLFERRPAGGAAAEARLQIASDGAVEHFYGRVWRSSRTHRPLLWSAVELHLVEMHGMTS